MRRKTRRTRLHFVGANSVVFANSGKLSDARRLNGMVVSEFFLRRELSGLNAQRLRSCRENRVAIHAAKCGFQAQSVAEVSGRRDLDFDSCCQGSAGS